MSRSDGDRALARPVSAPESTWTWLDEQGLSPSALFQDSVNRLRVGALRTPLLALERSLLAQLEAVRRELGANTTALHPLDPANPSASRWITGVQNRYKADPFRGRSYARAWLEGPGMLAELRRDLGPAWTADSFIDAVEDLSRGPA